jgi:Zn-dependent oligopeptidase
MEQTQITSNSNILNKEAEDLTQAIINSITPAMVNRLTENMEQIARISELLVNPEVTQLIEKLTGITQSLNLLVDILKQLHEQGTLEQLSHMVGVEYRRYLNPKNAFTKIGKFV